MRDKAQQEEMEQRQAHEMEENQAALRRSIEETQRLVNESEQILLRHRKEREEDAPDEG